MALLKLGSANDIFEKFIHGMTDMKRAIGVWRTVMKNEWFLVGSFLGLPFIKIVGTSLQVLWLLCRDWSRTGDVGVN